jgi:hypothetical protein
MGSFHSCSVNTIRRKATRSIKALEKFGDMEIQGYDPIL